MSRNSIPSLKSSFFNILLLCSVVFIGLMAVFMDSQRKLTTKSGAVAPTSVTVSSMNQIITILPSYSIGQTFTINVPISLYRQIYTGGATAFCSRVRWCTSPYDARFVATQNIYSSVTYINSPSNTLITANYYYLADGRGKAQISLLGCTLNTRNCSPGEIVYFQSLINDAVTQAFNAYYQYVDILAMNNDTSNLSIVFRVKALPPSPTPTPCIDSVPPAAPGFMTQSGNNPYTFQWGASGCSNNPKKYFFRRYNGAKPSGVEPSCVAGDTTSGSCWRTNLSINSVPIDFNNSTCMYYGTDKGCYVYVWAKDSNNRVSNYSYGIVYQR